MKRKKESIKLIVGTYRQSHHLRMTMGSLLAKPTSSRFKKKNLSYVTMFGHFFLGPRARSAKPPLLAIKIIVIITM